MSRDVTGPLLALSPERTASERRRAEERAAGDRLWRRRVWRLAGRCGAVYLVGLVIAYGSLALTGDGAEVAFWGGLLVGNSAILAFLLTMWSWEVL